MRDSCHSQQEEEKKSSFEGRFDGYQSAQLACCGNYGRCYDERWSCNSVVKTVLFTTDFTHLWHIIFFRTNPNKFQYFLLPLNRSASHFHYHSTLLFTTSHKPNTINLCHVELCLFLFLLIEYSTCVMRNIAQQQIQNWRCFQKILRITHLQPLSSQQYMLHNRFKLITRPVTVVLDRPEPSDSDIDDEEIPKHVITQHRGLKRENHSLLACINLRGRRQPNYEAILKREAVLINSQDEPQQEQDSQSGSQSLVFVKKVTSAQCLKRKLRRQATVCNKVKLQRRDQNTPECSICLTALKDLSEKQIGRLNCNHTFCYSCILESSKFSNRCPYCRATFSSIRHGKRVTSIPDARLNQGFDDPMDQPCYICGRNDDFQRLLECQYCEYAYCHTYCDVRLNSDQPPLGNWYCLSCVQLLNNQLDPNSAALEIFEDSS